MQDGRVEVKGAANCSMTSGLYLSFTFKGNAYTCRHLFYHGGTGDHQSRGAGFIIPELLL